MKTKLNRAFRFVGIAALAAMAPYAGGQGVAPAWVCDIEVTIREFSFFVA